MVVPDTSAIKFLRFNDSIVIHSNIFNDPYCPLWRIMEKGDNMNVGAIITRAQFPIKMTRHRIKMTGDKKD